MDPHFQVYADKRGRFRWRFLAANGQIIASASQGFATKEETYRDLETVQEGLGDYEMYKDTAGEFRWRLLDRGGRLIATSGEGYVKKSDCEHGRRQTIALSYNADLRDIS